MLLKSLLKNANFQIRLGFSAYFHTASKWTLLCVRSSHTSRLKASAEWFKLTFNLIVLTHVWDFGRTLGIPHQLHWWFSLPLFLNRAVGLTGLKYLSVMALLKILQGCLSRSDTSFCLTGFAHRNLPRNDIILFFVFQHAWSNGTMPTSQGPAKSCSCLLSCHLFLLRGIYQQVSMNSQLTTCYSLPNPRHCSTRSVWDGCVLENLKEAEPSFPGTHQGSEQRQGWDLEEGVGCV